MKHNSALVIAIAMTLASASSSAAASDGTITFNGLIEEISCAVTGGAGTDGQATDMVVTLPTVSTSALAAANSTAGSTPFELIVGGDVGAGRCDVNKVKTVMFELGKNENVEAATGNLKNTITDGAENVEIGLLNGDNNTEINLQTASAADLPTAVVADGQAVVKFVAQYESPLGDAKPGAVSSMAKYTVVYN